LILVSELIGFTSSVNLMPATKKILLYCWTPCRIQDFPSAPQTWVLWMLNPELNLLTYKYIKFYRAKQLQEIPDLPSEGVLLAFDNYWMRLIPWIYKHRWDKKHKLPRMEKETKKAIELEGKMWLYLLEICRGLVGYENEDKAIGLWGAALFEYKIFQLKKLYKPDKCPRITGRKKGRTVELDYGENTNKVWQNNGKQAIKQEFQSQLKALREGENPFNRNNQPWLRSIIQSVFDVLKIETNYSNGFRQKFWEPFISSRSEWVNNLESQGISFLWAENKEWYSRFPGTKRGDRKIPAFEVKNYLEAESLAQQEFEELSHSLSYPAKNEGLWVRESEKRTLIDSGQGYVVILSKEKCRSHSPDF
jgi:hypothetical protein